MSFPIHALRSLHIELTSRCNARCPMCPRNLNGGKVNPSLYLSDLTLKDFRERIGPEILQNLEDILFCGSYGDAIVHPDALEIFRYLREINPQLFLSLHTNGAARTGDWWRELGEIFGERGAVTFSIDGLEDTLGLYRTGCRYETVLRNSRAYIATGAEARWSFLIFRHNEHQVEEARLRSQEFGFRKFVAKKTARFVDKKTKQPIARWPVQNMRGEVERWLEPPSSSKNVSPIYRRLDRADLESYFDTVPVRCPELAQKRLYIAANGLVLPCGHLNHKLFDHVYQGAPEARNEQQAIDTSECNLKTHSLASILASHSFQRIYGNWHKPSIKEGRFKCCAWQCGDKVRKLEMQVSP